MRYSKSDTRETLTHGKEGQNFLSLILDLQLCLKVSWHDIFLFQNMLLINAFIKVAFLFFFFKFGPEIWLKFQVSKILVPETRAWIFLLL